jgi:peroxiredoxin
MKKLFLLLFLLGGLSTISQAQTYKPSRPVMPPEQITSNLQNWRFYESHYLNLNDDFVGITPQSAIITKTEALKMLMTGAYYPVKLTSKDACAYYKLYKFNDGVLAGFKGIVKDLATTEYNYYNKVNKAMPSFSFTDINGKVYTNANTKGKILVLKTWFIHCSACVQEFEEVNKVADQYKNRKDVLFISLAFDSKKELQQFLKTHPLNYAVVPGQESYLTNRLAIREYPTHIIVNRRGTIVAVNSYIDPITGILKKEAAL